MTNVIGFKGTAEDRAAAWTMMQLYKEGYETFRVDARENYKAIAEEDKIEYAKGLQKYVA